MYLSIFPERVVTGLGASFVVPTSVVAPALRCDTEYLAAAAGVIDPKIHGRPSLSISTLAIAL